MVGETEREGATKDRGRMEGHVRVLSKGELEEVLNRAREERWTDLAIAWEGDWNVTQSLIARGWPPTRVFSTEEPMGAEGALALASLRSLTSLRLGNNGIGAEGARALASLRSLTSLHLGGNGIGDEGARALASLRSLTSLHLWGNGIGDEGARALASLTNLASLDLSSNGIGAEGARALAALTSLASLDLGGNGIGDEGARALASLTSLASLDLSANGLGAEGARALASLTSLLSLDLSANGIGAEGARALASLASLTSLDLWGSGIGVEGARALASLRSLTSLHLWGNGIGDEGARALASLTNLASLDLSSNGIGDEGARALASLASLTSLDLSANGIGDEGARALTSLTSLASLHLAINEVTELRPLTALPRLKYLSAFGNPVAGIPQELLSPEYTNCLPALTAYYYELEKGGTPNDVVKILLVGNGCVGKTTLAHCLTHGHAPPAPIEERTHGIVLQRVALELPSGTSVDACIWDFGGQELYHATHRLFFHGNAIYLLLWAEETNEVPEATRHPVSYWLDMIRHLAEDAPVLLVKNQIDRSNKQGGPRELEGRELGDVIRVEISAVKYKNIAGLKAYLAEVIEGARHRWGYLIPKSWQQVRTTLEAWSVSGSDIDGTPLRMIPRGRFEQLCVKHGIDDPDVLLTFLHDTGELFHHPGRFGDAIILDQNWFIDAIYRLFDRKSGNHTRALERDGVLSGAESLLYWPDQSPEDRATYFDFMLQAGMAFELDRHYSKPFEERRIVVPALLPSADAPSLRLVLEQWDEPTDGESWLRVEYPFLHRGHIERIIVELSSLGEQRCSWREGIWVRDPHSDCRMFVQAKDGDRHIDVRLRQGRHGDAFAHIRALLDRLLRYFPSRILVSTDGKAFTDVTALDGHYSLSPFDRFIDPGPKSGRDMTSSETTQQRIRIFISYSHFDEAYRERLETRLKGIKRLLPIEFWADRQMLAGTTVTDEILARLAVADVVLLLISPEFMASEYCFSLEMAEALRKYEQNKGLPVPIVIRPESTWNDHEIGRHLALPKDGKAISKWPDPDDAWDDVSRGLKALLTDLAQKRGLLPP